MGFGSAGRGRPGRRLLRRIAGRDGGRPGSGTGFGFRLRRRHGSVGGAVGEETRQAFQRGNDDLDDPRAKRDPFAEAPEGLAELIEFAGCPLALAAGIAEGLERGVQLDGRFPEEVADPLEEPGG